MVFRAFGAWIRTKSEFYSKEIGLDSDSVIKQAQTDEIEQKYLKNTEMAKNKAFLEVPHLSLKMRFFGEMTDVKMP